LSLIWPFKRDPLESNAALLVGAVNTLAISTFLKFVDDFPFIPNDKHDQEYWDFIVTIAGVFIGLMGLRNLNLNAKRRLKLEKRVAASLVLMYPAIARPAFEKCKSFYDKAYDALLNAGDEPLVRADAIGSWVAWEVLRHPARTEQERRMARIVGLMITHSFFNWWEKDAVQRPAR
jgi:hypothetical protein